MDENYATTIRPNYHHYPDYAHSDGGSVTPPPSPSSSSSIVSLTNSSASSSNDNISYYILDKNNSQQKAATQQPQQQTNSKTVVVATDTSSKQKHHVDVDTELSNEFSCALSINGDDAASSNAVSRSSLSLEDDVDVEGGEEIEDAEFDHIVSERARRHKAEDEYEQSQLQQQQLLQQQIDQQRLAVLSFEQVSKLNEVMNEHVSIHGRGNFPTLEVRLKDFVTLVREKLELDIQKGGAGMCVKDIRLNGGAASHVLAYEAQSYNDLDLIFAVEISSNRHFDRVKSAVLSTISDLLPDGSMRKRITPGSLREAYVGKMVKVNNDGDRWSLISLGNSPGHKNVELKFVDTMRRQFEFSVDSFQIILDSLLLFYDCAELPISENFYPTVVGESVYGDFHEALYHLQNKLISTRQPEEIRGGGLLKYCNLLVRNYIPVDPKQIKKLERYMCSRFFIDFPDILQQRIKLEAYLRNHFWGIEEEPLQYHYLVHLHDVVENSTVCLMGHERRQTLNLIEHLAMQVSCRERQKMHSLQQHHQAQATIMLSPSHSHHHHQLTAHQQHNSTSHHHHHQIQQYQTTQSPTADVSHLMTQTQAMHLPATAQSIPPPPATAVSLPPPQTMQSAVVTQQPPQQTITATTTSTVTPQQIQLQPTSQPGLLYANGVYYAPVTICTCGNQNQYLLSTWCEEVPECNAGHEKQQLQKPQHSHSQQFITNNNNNNNYVNYNVYQQPTTSSSSNSFIDHHQNNISSHQQQVQPALYKESNLKRSHNIKASCIKKHVKFAKSSKPTASMMPSGRGAPQSAASSKFAMKSSTKKFKKISTKDHKMASSMEMEAAAMQQPLYYYYCYPEETLPSNALGEEQQYFYANNNNVYYYAIDGTSDVNYHPEFFIQPSAGSNENYMRWFGDIGNPSYGVYV